MRTPRRWGYAAGAALWAALVAPASGQSLTPQQQQLLAVQQYNYQQEIALQQQLALQQYAVQQQQYGYLAALQQQQNAAALAALQQQQYLNGLQTGAALGALQQQLATPVVPVLPSPPLRVIPRPMYHPR